MKVSIDIDGCYTEHKEYFDLMAVALQKAGHQVGIITGIREKTEDSPGVFTDRKAQLLQSLGFMPDFMHLWGQFETITNGSIWKVNKMKQEGVLVHYDDDAGEIKKFTDLWVIKVLNSSDLRKF